jgi:hypothetical protein
VGTPIHPRYTSKKAWNGMEWGVASWPPIILGTVLSKGIGYDGLFVQITEVQLGCLKRRIGGFKRKFRRGIWREHSSKKWIRPCFSVDLIKGVQMSRAKPKLTQIFHLSSGVPLTFFWGQFL